MKNKMIWFVMAGIVAIGILVTTCTTVYVKKQEVSEVKLSEVSGVGDSTIPVHIGETEAAVMTTGEERTLSQSEEPSSTIEPMIGAGEHPSVEPVISPLDPAVPPEESKADEEPEYVAANTYDIAAEETSNYRVRLEELDIQIQKIRDEGTATTTYSLKAAAENELKLWDGELNAIYNELLDTIGEEEVVKLVAEEREWMKKRDIMAVAAAKKSAGGTLEGLEYTASLATSTRERAYELVELYEAILENQNE